MMIARVRMSAGYMLNNGDKETEVNRDLNSGLLSEDGDEEDNGMRNKTNLRIPTKKQDRYKPVN